MTALAKVDLPQPLSVRGPPGGLVRAEWTTPIDGWQPDSDRLIFTRGSAVWQLPEGPLTYLDFRMPAGGVRYNVAPTEIMDASS
jgi:hypothetical protein